MAPPSVVKCLVWDLDDTLWSGVLLEQAEVQLRPEARVVLHALDQRGILHSIASRNDEARARAQLEAFGVADLFLAPRIGWGSKAESLRGIAAELGIGTDALAFVDDQLIERDEVQFSLPEVRCFDARDLSSLPGRQDFTPAAVTEEARTRRAMMRQDLARRQAEVDFRGTSDEFLATLELTLRISPALESDLARAGELTERTHQLNSTGYTYGHEELAAFSRSSRHHVWMASLSDRYGDYGKIGLALVERDPALWTIKLLLASCRVLNRGVGSLLVTWILRRAYAEGARVRAEFVPTSRNRVMYVAYRFAGFREEGAHAGVTLLLHDPAQTPAFPRYVRVL